MAAIDQDRLAKGLQQFVVPFHGEFERAGGSDLILSVDPRGRACQQACETWRKAHDDNARTRSWGRTTGMSKHGQFQHIAAIPPPVYAKLVQTRDKEWLYGEGFLKWLRQHPEYRTGRTQLVGR